MTTYNPRRVVIPCSSPSSSSESQSPSLLSSASVNSSTPSATELALMEANSYRRSVFPPTRARRIAIQLADAFTDLQATRGADCIRAALDATADQAEHTARLQTLVDLLIADRDASADYMATPVDSLAARTKARQVIEAQTALRQGIAEYRAAVQA